MSESRSYKVVLTDRTTSPKVNRYIRELTGKSVWEASQIMNTAPSVVMDNVPLHKAIEIKSQLGKLNLMAKIETSASAQPDQPEPAVRTPEPAPKPAEPAPAAAPASAEQPPAEPESTPPPEKIAPLPPSRLRHRKQSKKSVRKIVIPFIIILIIVIFILIIGQCPGSRINLTGGNISQTQESSDIPIAKRFVPSAGDIAERLKSAPGSPYISDSSDVYPDSAQYSENQPGDSSVPGESGSQHSSPNNPASMNNPAGAGSSPSLSPAQNNPGSASSNQKSPVGSQTPSYYNNAQQLPAVSSKPAGSKSSPLSDRPRSADNKIPSDFIGGKSPKMTAAKLNAILDHAKNSASSGDQPSAALDYQRLMFAEATADPAQFQIVDKLESPETQNLLDQLAPLAGKFDLKPQLAFQPEITGASIKIHSNLPDQAMLKVLLVLPGAARPLEYSLNLENGSAEIPISGGLPSGNIVLKIILQPLKNQPMEVLSVVGKNGENMNGPSVKGRGEVEFTGSLKNRLARTRGEIGVTEAEAELNSLIQSQGLNKYKLSDFREFAFEKKIFITISADGVDEPDFILKACRSVGLLTQEMDDPPLYLRLVVNGGQYFISTFQCRRLLREYRENDPAAFDLLLENLVTL